MQMSIYSFIISLIKDGGLSLTLGAKLLEGASPVFDSH
jgi:hypothetical protein